jgi:hypothetical protein
VENQQEKWDRALKVSENLTEAKQLAEIDKTFRTKKSLKSAFSSLTNGSS